MSGKPSIAGWESSMAKDVCWRISQRDREAFGFVEIKAMLKDALWNAYKAGWEDCVDRIQDLQPKR